MLQPITLVYAFGITLHGFLRVGCSSCHHEHAISLELAGNLNQPVVFDEQLCEFEEAKKWWIQEGTGLVYRAPIDLVLSRPAVSSDLQLALDQRSASPKTP